MRAGFRLRQVRERLGLTYRDVERASYELAVARGRSAFVLRISRLAAIENHGVVPGVHKLYTLAVLYHLNPLEISAWYGAPLECCLQGATTYPHASTSSPTTPVSLRLPIRFDPISDPGRLEYLGHLAKSWAELEAILLRPHTAYQYAYIGLCDHSMEPLLRPGAVLLIDPADHRIDDAVWSTQYDRPMYLVDLRTRYWCGWCCKSGSTLIIQPHPLSRCIPEAYRYPDEADVVGKVVGIAMRQRGL